MGGVECQKLRGAVTSEGGSGHTYGKKKSISRFFR